MLLFFGQIRPVADPGGGQNRSLGVPFFNELLLQTGRLQQQTECITMIYKHVGWSAVLFWFHSEVKFLRRFWRLFGLSHFAIFHCNFYRFLCGKVFNLHLFCVISVFLSGRCLYKRFKCLKNFNEFSMYLFRWRKGEGGCTNACICMGISQPLVQNHLMDVYETW